MYDAGIDDATRMPFLVMELLAGIELRQQLKNLGRLRPEDVALYMYQTALALEKTHRSNIIHRDLKPENLFLTFRENGAPHIKILDFGVAKFVTEIGSQTSATRDVGTPLYMGPEQFTMDAKHSPQTDIYALGMIAYTLLTGVTYWADDNHAATTIYAFAMHVVKGPPELSTVRAYRRGVRLPPAFDIWFARATARDPQRRFPSAITAANELADALGVPRMGTENSMATTNAGMRTAMGSSVGTGLQAIGRSGVGIEQSLTPEPSNATGAPLSTTAGSRKESKGRIVIAGIGMAVLLIVGLIVVFTQGSSEPATGAAASANAVNAKPSTAVATAPPAITPIPEPTLSASTLTAPQPKTASKSTGSAKPVATSVAPKKDLFTRD